MMLLKKIYGFIDFFIPDRELWKTKKMLLILDRMGEGKSNAISFLCLLKEAILWYILSCIGIQIAENMHYRNFIQFRRPNCFKYFIKLTNNPAIMTFFNVSLSRPRILLLTWSRIKFYLVIILGNPDFIFSRKIALQVMKWQALVVRSYMYNDWMFYRFFLSHRLLFRLQNRSRENGRSEKNWRRDYMPELHFTKQRTY